MLEERHLLYQDRIRFHLVLPSFSIWCCLHTILEETMVTISFQDVKPYTKRHILYIYFHTPYIDTLQ